LQLGADPSAPRSHAEEHQSPLRSNPASSVTVTLRVVAERIGGRLHRGEFPIAVAPGMLAVVSPRFVTSPRPLMPPRLVISPRLVMSPATPPLHFPSVVAPVTPAMPHVMPMLHLADLKRWEGRREWEWEWKLRRRRGRRWFRISAVVSR